MKFVTKYVDSIYIKDWNGKSVASFTRALNKIAKKHRGLTMKVELGRDPYNTDSFDVALCLEKKVRKPRKRTFAKKRSAKR